MANTVLLESRPYRPFKSSEEYLYAMREDLAEWLNIMYPELHINTDNFMDRLDTGVALCKHANNVRKAAEEYLQRRQARNKSMTKSMTSGLAGPILAMGNIHFLPAAKSGTFFARDNVSNFISWCRKSLQIFECLLFETDDLIMRKNEKHVILCLLEVARRGAKFGMLAPMLVQMERQIDREIAAENKANGVPFGTQTENGLNSVSIGTDGNGIYDDTDTDDEDADNEPVLMYGPQPQIITNDLKSLDEMVRELVEQCTCPSQFPMVRVSEGKYRIGDTKVLIFVRTSYARQIPKSFSSSNTILRSHVMVRVGGGWDTLSHYLDKHDPCRCRAQHRSSVAARLITRTNHETKGIELHKAQVFYDRSPPTSRRVSHNPPSSSVTNGNNNNNNLTPNGHNTNSNGSSTLSPPSRARSRSRSPTPQRIKHDHLHTNDKNHLTSANSMTRRSASPAPTTSIVGNSPRRINDFKNKKQHSLDSSSTIVSSSHHHHHHHHHHDDVTSSTPINNGDGTIIKPTEIIGGNTTIDNGKFENISDNGSEISDEGYRSLGIIQSTNVANNNNNGNGNNQNSNQLNRTSLHSQTSTEDADLNARLDQTSSDSQISPTDEEPTSKCTDLLESSPDTIDADTDTTFNGGGRQPTIVIDNASSMTENENNFEKSGIFITDDDITVDIASSTGLRKTGFSDNLYGDDGTLIPNNNNNGLIKKSPTSSKIPRSPISIRRRSMDNVNVCTDNNTTGLPIISRKTPVYRSVRKPMINVNGTSSTTKMAIATNTNTTAKDTISSALKHQNGTHHKELNTWSGGKSTKKRASINADTFNAPSALSAASASSPTSNTTQHTNKVTFNRNSPIRHSQQQLYDKNGRRIKSTNSSPTKSIATTTTATNNNNNNNNNNNVINASTSPLAQQILEAAGNAKNDIQIIEKMKELLCKYTKTNEIVTSPNHSNNSNNNNNNNNQFIDDHHIMNHNKNINNNNNNNDNDNVTDEVDGDDFDENNADFTAAWVHNNGVIERRTSSSISSNSSPIKSPYSKRSSAASITDDSIHSKDLTSINGSIATNTTNAGSGRRSVPSKIPAPIRHNTDLH